MLATIAQLAGLFMLVVGLGVAVGFGGVLIGAGLLSVYVGAAADRRGSE